MFSEINEKITANTGMKGKKQIDIIKTNKPFSIRVLYISTEFMILYSLTKKQPFFNRFQTNSIGSIGNCVICALSGLRTIFLAL